MVLKAGGLTQYEARGNVMWIELHDTMIDHRKLRRLSSALNIPPVYARGHLVTLWLNVLRHASDGNLVDWSDDDIAHYSDWPGDPTKYVDALGSSGWLVERDDHLEVNDWAQYATHIKNAERKRAERVRKSTQPQASCHVTDRDVTGQSVTSRHVTRNLNQNRIRTEPESEPNRTEPAQSATHSALVVTASPVLLSVPLNGGGEHHITQAEVAELAKAYPAVDVPQQLEALRQWNIANPTRRKTPKGIRRHIVEWLARQQDRGRPAGMNGQERLTGKAASVRAAIAAADPDMFKIKIRSVDSAV